MGQSAKWVWFWGVSALMGAGGPGCDPESQESREARENASTCTTDSNCSDQEVCCFEGEEQESGMCASPSECPATNVCLTCTDEEECCSRMTGISELTESCVPLGECDGTVLPGDGDGDTGDGDGDTGDGDGDTGDGDGDTGDGDTGDGDTGDGDGTGGSGIGGATSTSGIVPHAVIGGEVEEDGSGCLSPTGDLTSATLHLDAPLSGPTTYRMEGTSRPDPEGVGPEVVSIFQLCAGGTSTGTSVTGCNRMRMEHNAFSPTDSIFGVLDSTFADIDTVGWVPESNEHDIVIVVTVDPEGGTISGLFEVDGAEVATVSAADLDLPPGVDVGVFFSNGSLCTLTSTTQ